MSGTDFSQVKKLRDELVKFQEQEAEQFCVECAKELAARLLASVVKRTPVGDYSREIEVTAKRDSKYHKKGDVYTKRVNPSGRHGGTLRRGWTSKTQQEAESRKDKGKVTTEYIDSLAVEHVGDKYRISIGNPVSYARFVEYGHRTPNHRGWVPGDFMLTVSEKEIREAAPGVLEKKLNKKLREVWGRAT